MDVNGTGFHLLLGKADWASGTWSPEVTYDDVRDELTLRGRQFIFPPAPQRGVLDITARRGAARDRFGSWYWVDRDPSQLSVSSAGSGVTSRFWPAPAQPSPAAVPGSFGDATAPPVRDAALAGAAVTEDAFLVAGSLVPGGLLVFDLLGGGAPQRLEWDAGSITVFDLAARPGGGVVALDRAARHLWELDRALQIISRDGGPGPHADVFVPVPGAQPAAPEPGRRLTGPSEADAVALEADAVAPGGDPVAVDCCSDGTVVVLFRHAAASSVRAYREGVPAAPPVRLPSPDGDPAGSFRGHDLALLAPGSTGPGALARLFVSDQHGDQVYEFALGLSAGALTVTPRLRYLPMRLHGGKAIVAAGGQIWYDAADAWLPLTEQPFRRYETAGTFTTDIMDGAKAGCVWHRLMIDAVLPPETSISIESAASDDAAQLRDTPDWQDEPKPYQRGRGSELPFTAAGCYRTLELAFQQARGRYLRLRLSLQGNGRSTPRIRALRAYFPRFSYLERYLPTVYREDADSASFLDRWLANLEGIATDLEGRIAASNLLFDPRTAPAESLEWLADWLGLALDPAWSPATRRMLLTNAMQFFAWRGTMRGLTMALALVIEDQVDASLFTAAPDRCALRTRIIELHRTKVTPGVALGDPTADLATVPATGWWTPAAGAHALQAPYAEARAAAGLAPGLDSGFPVRPPEDAGELRVWSDFARQALGFVPQPVDPQQWRDFLTRRYPGTGGLSGYGVHDDTQLQALLPPDRLPDAEFQVRDWYQMQTVVLRTRATAHRFRVLLPVSTDVRKLEVADAIADRRQKLTLAERIVNLEKPAHTTFDVRFYWDAFRVGEARLGIDTLVDLGSRSPLVLMSTVLDQAVLGTTVLDRGDPGRRVLPASGELSDDRRCP
jgi:phage tail-like protein